MSQLIEGVLPAIASPCDEKDRFDADAFAGLASWLYDAGVQGLYVCGGTGDGMRMRLDERRRAAEIAVRVSRERGGVAVIHVGTYGSRDAVELAEAAADAGAHAVASMPPPAASQPQLLAYYRDIARVGLPTLVYHVPVVTGRTFTLDEMLQLLDIDGVAGMKYTDSDLFFMRRVLRERPGSNVLSGYDELMCPSQLYGAHGAIGLWFNLFPALFRGIYTAVRDGEVDRAMEGQHRLTDFAEIPWRWGIRPIFERLMIERGQCRRVFRAPRVELDDETYARAAPMIRERIEAIETWGEAQPAEKR